jgi:hypothetical protein
VKKPNVVRSCKKGKSLAEAKSQSPSTDNVENDDGEEYFGCGGGCHSLDDDNNVPKESNPEVQVNTESVHIDIENLAILAKSMLASRQH